MAARAAWNHYLGRADIDGTDEQKVSFYTALYHAFIQPNNIADVDGRYRGADGKVSVAESGRVKENWDLLDAHGYYPNDIVKSESVARRVWFDGALVVDKWTNGPKQTRTFKKNLVAGKKYALKIEAYQNGGDWLASFKWKLPLPDVKCDLPDILRRVREDGTKLVLVEDAETWLKKLRDAQADFC